MNILLTICARGGSKGVKNKNIRLIAGRALIAYTIDVAKRWGKAAHIICSTDSQAIAEVAREQGIEVPFLRPAELATDTAGKIPVIRHALQECERLYQEKYDLVVDLDATSPLRTTDDLDNCLKLFLEKQPDIVFSVVPAHRNPYFNMVEDAGNGFVTLCKPLAGGGRSLTRRQDAPAVYDMNASIYFYRPDFLLNPATISPLSTTKAVAYVMHESCAIDIDTEADFDYFEYLLKKKSSEQNDVMRKDVGIRKDDTRTYNTEGDTMAKMTLMSTNTKIDTSADRNTDTKTNMKTDTKIETKIHNQNVDMSLSYPHRFQLFGKNAVVCGGLGLIGREITKALAQAGAKVIVLDIDEEKGQQLVVEYQRQNMNVSFVRFDLTKTEEFPVLLSSLSSIHGDLHIWVNTAYPRTSDWGNFIEDVSASSWEKNIAMQLNSSCLSIKAAAQMMKTQGIKGTIISLGSIYGVVAPDFQVYPEKMTCPAAYAAIKGGIISFSRYCASYFGPDGIRINTVCPGGVFDNQDTQFVHNYEQRTPLRRMARPEDIASAILFLASDASSYITGTSLLVDGGWTCI